MLVSVEGNTYLSVPILGFGAENDDGGNREKRMPWLSAEHAFGDTSPVTRFVMGHEASLPQSLGSSRDPWNEDLFHRRLRIQSPVPGPEPNDTGLGDDPNAMRRGRRQDDQAAEYRFVEKPFDESGLPSLSTASRIVAGFKGVAVLLATVVPMPMILVSSRISGRPAERRMNSQPGDEAR
jgi:hypothetical protein